MYWITLIVARKQSLGQGNVFTPVWNFVASQHAAQVTWWGGVYIWGESVSWGSIQGVGVLHPRGGGAFWELGRPLHQRHMGYYEIWLTSGRYASYCTAFLLTNSNELMVPTSCRRVSWIKWHHNIVLRYIVLWRLYLCTEMVSILWRDPPNRSIILFERKYGQKTNISVTVTLCRFRFEVRSRNSGKSLPCSIARNQPSTTPILTLQFIPC